VDFYRDILEKIAGGVITSPDELQNEKIALARRHAMAGVPGNAEILAHAGDLREQVIGLLRKKPTRSLSGVAVVAVMTSPHPCPHGKCVPCPGGVEYGTAQSYTGQEPAAQRAAAHGFDPHSQTTNRLEQLRATGHDVDKIDLIVMGGTFPARGWEYREWFVRRCLDGLNGADSGTLAEAQRLNETAGSRCVGLTFETRPDRCREKDVDEMLRLGGTRVELGVQTVYDDILERMERGHTVRDSVEATRIARDAGLKVCYHMMPFLPGSNAERDLEMFRTVFEDERFMPDMLKIYPTLVVEGTRLHDMWRAGEYEPVDSAAAVVFVAKVKAMVPPWVRIQRVQRDIPSQLISAGVDKSNLRQLAVDELHEMGGECQCIRCREVGRVGAGPDTGLDVRVSDYAAGGGTEHFISLEREDGALVGYARLRFPSELAHRPEVAGAAVVRELKVFGEVVPIGEAGGERWQHRGHGTALMDEAGKLALEKGVKRLLVLSGVGVKGYYRKLGHGPLGPYMGKQLV